MKIVESHEEGEREEFLDLGNSHLNSKQASSALDNCIDQINIGVHDNEKLSWTNSVGVLKRTGLLMSNLASVYYLEYLITTGLTVAIGG